MSDPAIADYLTHLRATRPAGSVRHAEYVLGILSRVLGRAGVTATTATGQDLADYQVALATPIGSTTIANLGVRTQQTHLGTVRSFYAWLRGRHLTSLDATQHLHPPQLSRRQVMVDVFGHQECLAFFGVARARIERATVGTTTWAIHWRAYAMIVLGLATGRRSGGLCATKGVDLLLDRAELRVPYEKGRVGGHLPLPPWAVQILSAYCSEARPVLRRGERSESDFLFPSKRRAHVSEVRYTQLFADLLAQTVSDNPDLTDLANKHLTPHSLRATCATFLTRHGCDLRTIQLVLLHENMGTTAKYAQVTLSDLHRTVSAARLGY